MSKKKSKAGSSPKPKSANPPKTPLLSQVVVEKNPVVPPAKPSQPAPVVVPSEATPLIAAPVSSETEAEPEVEAELSEEIYIPGWSEQLGELALAYKWWGFGAILGIAAGLWLWRLDFRSLWYDESFSLTLAGRDISNLLTGTANDYHPPLPYLVLKGWMQLFGDSVYSGRLLSVVFGLGFVAVVYGLAKELFGSRTALLAMLLAAVAPFQILYSQEVRHYSLQALLGTGLVWAFYRAWRRSRWAWGLYAVVATLALYNLYFSIFGLVTLGLFFIIATWWQWRVSGRRNWRQVGWWAAANIVIGLAYAPWALTVLLRRAGEVKKAYWIDTPNPLEFLRLTDVFLVNATNLTVGPELAVAGLLFGALITLFLLYSLRFRLKRGAKGQRRRSFEICLMLTYWLGTVGLVLVVSYLFAPLYLERSLIGYSAPLYILLARVIQTARYPWRWFGLIIPGIVILVGALAYYYFSPEYSTHYDNAAVTAYIRAGYQAGDVTLHSSKLSYLPLAYLKAPGPQFLAPEEPNNIHDDLSKTTLEALNMSYTPLPELLAQVQPGGRIWFVRTNPQPGQTETYLDRLQQQFAARFAIIERREFYGIVIFLYKLNPN